MSAIRVVHTADAHLGKRFPHMDKDAEAVRAEDIFRVFGEMIDYTIKNQAHLLLIAGDLFSRVNIKRETISRVLEWFSHVHEKLPRTRIVLTPGEDEIFVRKDGEVDCTLKVFEHLSYVDVIGAGDDVDRRVYELDGQDVTVSSCRFDKFFEPDFRARNILPVKRGFGIFLLHAHSRRRRLTSLGETEFRNSVLDPLATRGYGYCALGHNHNLTVIEHEGITGVYPGSLERLSFDDDRSKKHFVAFTIDKDGHAAPPEPVRTRMRPLEYVTITCTLGEDKLDSVLQPMLQRSGKDKILYIALEGQMEFDVFNRFKNSETVATLKESYAIVHVDNRLILVDGESGYDFNALRVGTPAEEFRRYMARELNQVEPGSDEHRLLEELYEMGMREIEQNS